MWPSKQNQNLIPLSYHNFCYIYDKNLYRTLTNCELDNEDDCAVVGDDDVIDDNVVDYNDMDDNAQDDISGLGIEEEENLEGVPLRRHPTNRHI